MADVKEKKEKVVKKSDVSREEFDNLAAKVRLISNNWHKYCAKYIGGGAKNGSIDGHAKISGLITIAVVAMVTIALGSGEILDYSSGNNGTVRINRVSAGVNSMEADTFIGAVTGNVTGDVTGTVTSDGAPVTTFGNGSLNTTNVTSVVENGDGLSHQTVITLTGTASSIADGGFEASQLLYTFPEGAILFEGCVADLTLTMATTNFNASTDDLYNVALGTAVNDDGDGTISATGANLLANQSVDTDGGQTQTNSVTAHLATALIIDGTSTANSMYLNWAVPAANDNGANTNSITGTITVTWKNLGDY